MNYNTIIKCNLVRQDNSKITYPDSYLLIYDINDLDSFFNVDLKGGFDFNTYFDVTDFEVVKTIKTTKDLYDFCEDKDIYVPVNAICSNGLLVGAEADYFISTDLSAIGHIDADIEPKPIRNVNRDLFKEVSLALVNYKRGNRNYNYDIKSPYKNYSNILNRLETKEERKSALQMLYVKHNDYDLLKKWSLKNLEDYVFDTLDNKYRKEYKKFFKIVRAGKEKKLDEISKEIKF